MTDTTADTTSARALATADDPVAAAIAAMAPDILNRLTADFEDSVLLIGREAPTSSSAMATAPTCCASTSPARSPIRPSSPPSCWRS